MLVAFAWLLIAAGLLGLINPRWIRMANRKQAVLAFILGVIIGVFSFPSSGPPGVPEASITHAYDVISAYSDVRDSHIAIDGRQIILSVVVPASTSQTQARQLGDNFARALSSGAAIHSDFAGPAGNNIGSLYDEYDLQVIVAWSADNVIAQGAKARTANQIRW